MKTVVLIGTDHKFQMPYDDHLQAGIECFRNTVRELITRHSLCAIAEEMSLAALKYEGFEESVAQRLCIEFGGIPHNFSDPSRGEERDALGIGEDSGPSYRIREREWFRRIQVFDEWPLLFICGAIHVAHFAQLLRENGVNVIEAYQDWGPIIEVKKPSPLYSDDRMDNAGPLTCLNNLKLSTARQLAPGERIKVNKIRAGKDFLAFKIEANDASEGWVLSENEGMVVSYPT